MLIYFQPLWLQKEENSIEEYNDAFYPLHTICEGQNTTYHFALADGASEGMHNGIWARLLVKKFCKKKSDIFFLEKNLPEIYKKWELLKDRYINKRKNERINLKWYEEEWINIGAFTTFLGLILEDSGNNVNSGGKWAAIAVGDTCLFQIREEKLLISFPMTHSSEFNNQPPLISSNYHKNRVLSQKIKQLKGDWQDSDSFYLMTDALACWFLKDYESGCFPWSILRDFDTRDEPKPFKEWIHELKSLEKIKDDDITFLRIDIFK